MCGVRRLRFVSCYLITSDTNQVGINVILTAHLTYNISHLERLLQSLFDAQVRMNESMINFDVLSNYDIYSIFIKIIILKTMPTR